MTIRVLILSFCFLLVFAFVATASRSEAKALRQPLKVLPIQIREWQGQDAGELKTREIAILGVTDYVNRLYSAKGVTIGMYVGFHASQREGSAIHSPMNCLPGAGWNPVERSQLAINVLPHPGAAATRSIVVNRVVIEKGPSRQMAVYWYQSHGRVVASEYWGKIYTVLDSIRSKRTDAALIRVIVPIRGDGLHAQIAAEAEAVGFVQEVFPLLSNHLPD